MSKKIKTLNDEKVLEPYITQTAKYAVNPKYTYAPDRDGLTRFMKNLDSVQACNRFEWVNCPKSIPAFRIEQMLYNRGALVFFKQANQFRLLPFFANEELNLYGLMKKVTPIAYNGTVASVEDAKKQKPFLRSHRSDTLRACPYHGCRKGCRYSRSRQLSYNCPDTLRQTPKHRRHL